MKKYLFLLIMLVLAMIFISGIVMAEQITMSLSYGGSEGGEDDISAKKFKELLEAKTNGAIKVELFCCEQLGKEVDIVTSLELGTVDMAIMGTTIHQQAAPEYNIWSAYYIFENRDEVLQIMNGPIGERVGEAMLKNKGIRMLGIGLRGPRHLTSNRPIMTAEEVKGLKIRIPLQPIYVKSWEKLGAFPEAIALGELYTALKQGIVEAQENPLDYIYSIAFYEVQKYVNLTAHQRSFFTYVMSEKFFQRLDEELQKAVLEAAEETAKFHNELQQANEDIWRQKLEEKGMEFIEVDQDSFKEALKDIPDEFADTWAPGFYEELKAELAKIRG
ncbi:MAG: TRAP-type C4-dicarboxylate transport system,periplasmic component [candidate division TA06 bacterium 34_109]|uniref:TRAP-type C4-dicarboxylate transport system,periplasmic component n=1 Tax=candidate division TA06 bacterium 34_109 TaxID=1635277 RepID=A0A117M619_UNCT6|nr:MAG: TRAP-type C4-dicarboxylate transport system,periplasmic component [candidate division TA06 bacterium 34_109]